MLMGSLKSFALSVSFCSPRAYKFVRKMFNNSLRILSTISTWYSTPGFTQKALTALKLKQEQTASQNTKILCNLAFDEMSIRNLVEWRPNLQVMWILAQI